MAINSEDIAALAQKYWEEEGRPRNRANEHWLRAEAELRQALEVRAGSAPGSEIPLVDTH